MCKEIIDVGGY
jgi:hypothetical protein